MDFTISAEADVPCTIVGTITSSASGYLLAVIFFISSTAAPISDVATPIFLGKGGSGFLISSLHTPSFNSLSLSCSNARLSAPTPSGCISST